VIRWYRAHRDVVDNTVSLVGSAAVTSGLGFAFWWLAARLFAPEAIGLASAGVAGMLLMSTMGVIGLDALVISEIPRNRATAGRLVSTAVLTSFVTTALLGLGFALLAPLGSENLAAFFATPGRQVVFALGVGLTGATFVFDRAMVGFLRGGVQFRRNVWFSVLKLVLLPALLLSAWATERADIAIYAMWAATTLASLAVVLPAAAAIPGLGGIRPDWSLLRRLRAAAWRHHLLNVVQHGPGLAMPVLVVTFFPAEVGAAFYVTWMLVTFAQVVPIHLTTVLHAVGATDLARLAAELRTTLRLSVVAAIAVAVAFGLMAGPLLRLFGEAYADSATAALRVLALTVLPIAVKVHYFALARIHGRIASAARVGALAGLIELGAAAVGARSGDLATMSWSLLAALTVVAIALAPSVLRSARPTPTARTGPDTPPRSAPR